MFSLKGEAGYLAAMQHIMTNGIDKQDRTGTGTRSIFGQINMEFDLTLNGYGVVPIPSTKKILVDKYLHELVWMLSGSSRIEYLLENGVHIWDDWVLKGTEVFGGLLSHADRIRLLQSKKADVFEAFLEMSNKAYLSDVLRLEDQARFMDNAGIPTHELVGGDLGPVYGKQWRETDDTRYIEVADWTANADNYERRGFQVVGRDMHGKHITIQRKIDQLAAVEDALRNNVDSRRIIMSAWNVARLDEMALPPCHTLAQWYTYIEPVSGESVLDCKLYQRSADFFLGCPFNFGFYSVLTHMLAELHGHTAGKLYHTVGDAHIYSNHFDQVRTQLSRQPIPENFPTLTLYSDNDGDPYNSVSQFKFSDIKIEGYEHHSFIKAKVAV